MDIITLSDITSADWSMALDAAGEPGSGLGQVVQGLADVNQCIQIILTTPKGSDPLRPTFGADVWRYIDFPIDSAIPAIVAEVTAAIMTWEPRVKVTAVTASPLSGDSGQLFAQLGISVTWQLKLGSSGSNGDTLQTSAVSLPGGLANG
ncbi:MAG: GPW/gp25 family protein [Candidatus Binataceae bacterium]